jgi:hypothetical protein
MQVNEMQALAAGHKLHSGGLGGDVCVATNQNKSISINKTIRCFLLYWSVMQYNQQ